ncbi:MAG TPA: bis-aminopropyl spermidine synthase family protein [Streptosporangiaceae bacterium]|nr:bis-aminopropyl spermidine synthase family protein [Streptosporangiaceae bacterium]
MDMDAVIADVALAVGLAEGRSGVSDVLRAIARSEPVAVREVSRMVELPVPIVAAVCNELRQRGVVDRARPVRLTPAARALLAGQHPEPSAACPDCGGTGLRVPGALAGLQARLERAAAGAPGAKPELDQTHCTVDTKIRRVLRMHEAGALAGRRILLLGDDDLISVAIAAAVGPGGLAAGVERLTVVDSDPEVLTWSGEQISGTGVAAELVEHDLRRPLPAHLAGTFDVACTDPPYTVAGAELFLSRAVDGLAAGPGRHVFFSFGARRPDETLRAQELIGAMGLAIRGLWPGFNTYLGAGILAGTSHLYHLRSTATARPLVEGEFTGPLYTAQTRPPATRPYRCAGCRAVHQVGPGRRWPRIAALQEAGCPQCGGTVFRPMPRQARPGPGAS